MLTLTSLRYDKGVTGALKVVTCLIVVTENAKLNLQIDLKIRNIITNYVHVELNILILNVLIETLVN